MRRNMQVLWNDWASSDRVSRVEPTLHGSPFPGGPRTGQRDAALHCARGGGGFTNVYNRSEVRWSKQTSKKQLKGPTGWKSHVHLCALGQLCLRFAACWVDVQEAVGSASPFVACSRPCRISRPDQLVAVSAFRTSPCPYMQHTIYCIHIQYTYSKKHIHHV